MSDVKPIGYRCWSKSEDGAYKIWFSHKREDDGFECSGCEAIYTENQIKVLTQQLESARKITVKRLEWLDSPYHGEWQDVQFGFSITEDKDDDPEFRFSAAWGEGDCELFSELEDAKTWCQKQLEDFVHSMIEEQ